MAAAVSRIQFLRVTRALLPNHVYQGKKGRETYEFLQVFRHSRGSCKAREFTGKFSTRNLLCWASFFFL